jgi:pimeloyl-ACP methyl ester carboxylesterase
VPTASANGINIRYERFGPASGTPLVMNHGFAGPIDQWKDELQPLAEKRPLVMYDVRGHGQTTVPESLDAYSLPTFASDLAGLLSALGIERVHVGGVSMGGMVTAQFAVDYPQMCASVMVIDSTCGNAPVAGRSADDPADAWEHRLREGIRTLEHMVQKYGLEETVKREQAWKLENDPHLDVSPYSFEDDFTRIKLMTVPGYVGAAHAIAERPDLTDRIGHITAPTLVMIGEWDDFLPCALRDHALIPGSRLVVRERCGHGSRWRLETFLSQVEAFLNDVTAGCPVSGQYSV